MISIANDLFDLPVGKTYLNCAYMAPLATPVLKAGQKALAMKRHPWELGPDAFFQPTAQAKDKFAELFGLERDGVFVASSASFGLNTAATNLPFDKGQSVAVLSEQFPSNVYPWTALAKANAGKVITIDRGDAKTWTEAVLRTLDDKSIRILAVPHCHWTDGSILDLYAISKEAKSRGIHLVLDLSQSLGASPIDLKKIDPDFVVSVAYKWLFGPLGTTFGFAAKKWREGTPLDPNWINRDRAEDFARLVEYTETFQPGAGRYDLGGKDPVNYLMAGAALDLLKQWTVDGIAAHASALNDLICKEAGSLGLKVPTEQERSPHMIGLGMPAKIKKETMAQQLTKAGISVSVRGSSIRVSPHVYNNENDVDRLVEAIKTVVSA